MNYEVQENSGLNAVNPPQTCISRAVLYSCEA